MSQEPKSPAALLAECRAALDGMESVDRAATCAPWKARKIGGWATIHDGVRAVAKAYASTDDVDSLYTANAIVLSRNLLPGMIKYLRWRVREIDDVLDDHEKPTTTPYWAYLELRKIHALLTGGSDAR